MLFVTQASTAAQPEAWTVIRSRLSESANYSVSLEHTHRDFYSKQIPERFLASPSIPLSHPTFLFWKLFLLD